MRRFVVGLIALGVACNNGCIARQVNTKSASKETPAVTSSQSLALSAVSQPNRNAIPKDVAAVSFNAAPALNAAQPPGGGGPPARLPGQQNLGQPIPAPSLPNAVAPTQPGSTPADANTTPAAEPGSTTPAVNPAEPATDGSTDSQPPSAGVQIRPVPEPLPNPTDGGTLVPQTTAGPNDAPGPLSLADIVQSIHATFPLVQAAYQQNGIATGNLTSAWGNFDTKLKAATENGPLGFYETYRHSAGFTQPVYRGGEVFGGYRVGRGDFQPWYLERQTNEGGEFKAGINIPLLRNRRIDERRAAVWRATYELQRAEPEIRQQLIMFVRDGGIMFWSWVAAGQKYDIGKRALQLAEQRNEQLQRKVQVGDVDPPVLQDSLRAIAKRQAKLVDLGRKFEQTAIKLSLFSRTANGEPLVPMFNQLVQFPEPLSFAEQDLEGDIQAALSQRPELAVLDATTRAFQVDLAQARNNMLPSVDAQVVGSQDVGLPTSKKRDKSQFELEAGLFVSVPLQRRKARGKARAVQAKLAQLAAKRRFTVDKIRTQLQSAMTALRAAFNEVEQARESRRLAEYMAEVERRKFQLGQSDLLAVALREQYAIEAAESEVDALLNYFAAKADYDAAMANEFPQ